MILSSPDVHLIYINGVKFIAKEMKKALRETKTQTLHAGCSKAEPKKICPAVDPFPGARNGQNLISWRLRLVVIGGDAAFNHGNHVKIASCVASRHDISIVFTYGELLGGHCSFSIICRQFSWKQC